MQTLLRLFAVVWVSLVAQSPAGAVTMAHIEYPRLAITTDDTGELPDEVRLATIDWVLSLTKEMRREVLERVRKFQANEFRPTSFAPFLSCCVVGIGAMLDERWLSDKQTITVSAKSLGAYLVLALERGLAVIKLVAERCREQDTDYGEPSSTEEGRYTFRGERVGNRFVATNHERLPWPYLNGKTDFELRFQCGSASEGLRELNVVYRVRLVEAKKSRDEFIQFPIKFITTPDEAYRVVFARAIPRAQ